MNYAHYMNVCSSMYWQLESFCANTAVHYCTIQTFDKIMETGFLRAVDSRFMNDLGEYQFGSEILKNVKYKNVKLNPVVPMTVSFSLESDLTPQWALYAKETGIGIEFDFDFHRYWSNLIQPGKIYQRGTPPTIAQVSETDAFIDTGIPYPLKINYLNASNQDPDIIKALIYAIEQVCHPSDPDFTAAKIEELLPLAATFIKSDDFEYEKEARISTFLFERNKCRSKILFHANGTYLRPFVNLCYVRSAPEIQNRTKQENIGWPVKTIWVGPGRNQEKAVESVIKRLEFGTVKVFGIPYEIFVERLKEYLEDMVEYVYNRTSKTSRLPTQIRNSIVDSITSNLFKGVKYTSLNGTKYLACIDKDNFCRTKKVLNDISSVIINKLTASLKLQKKDVVMLIAEFNKYNYFSWHGIRVRASSRRFSFV